VTLKVFKLIGPSNDGRRHGRGTYLFFQRMNLLNTEPLTSFGCPLNAVLHVLYADPILSLMPNDPGHLLGRQRYKPLSHPRYDFNCIAFALVFQ
jgi:hypothetical protein